MISRYLYILIVVLLLSCNKKSTSFLHQNDCGGKSLLVYQAKNPTKNTNKNFIIVIYFWDGNFKAFLNRKEILYEQTDEETIHYRKHFEVKAKNYDTISIVYDNGKCLNFNINDKFFIYQIHKSTEHYRLNVKNEF